MSSVIFAVTFAVGSGLAGLGGALGAEILGLDPTFPLKFMIYFLIVVTVGGTTSITGPFLASLLLGIADVAGKYYVPSLGAFVIYTLMIVVLICARRAFSHAAPPDERDPPAARRPSNRLSGGLRRVALALPRSPSGSRRRAPLSPARRASHPERDRDPRRCSRSRST